MKALIVDDEEEIRNALTAGLEHAQCGHVDTAANGEEALRLGLRTEYDLITLDIRMPSLSGIDILPTFRTLLPHAVIAIVSAFVAESVTSVHREHADLVLQKPFEMSRILELCRLSKEIVERRVAIRALGEWRAAGHGTGQESGPARVRVVRVTDHLEETVRFYRDGVGFAEAKEEHGQSVLNLSGAGCQFMFTQKSDRPVEKEILVLSVRGGEAFSGIVFRLGAMGYEPAASRGDREVMFEDPDGRQLVVQRLNGPEEE